MASARSIKTFVRASSVFLSTCVDAPLFMTPM